MNPVVGAPRLVFPRILLAALWGAACSGASGAAKEAMDAGPSRDVTGAADAADATATPDLRGEPTGESDSGGHPAEEVAPPAVRICDGSIQLRLSVRLGGGGPSSAGQTMLAENGFRSLLVDGTCHAWLLRNYDEPLRELTLSAAQEATLSAALQLSTWESFAPTYPGGCPDAPSMSYRFGAQAIQGPTCGLPAIHPLRQLNEMFSAQLELLSGMAAPVTGDLRYILVLEQPTAPVDSRPPVPWPLSIPIESVTIPRGEELGYRPGNSRLASGDDAEQLRAIRTTNANESTGPGRRFDYTRVQGTDGTIYQLFLRDAVPGEQANGLLPAGTF